MATTFPDPAPGSITFEHVWTILQENAEQLKETDRRMQEQKEKHEEEWRELKEQMKETDRQMKETDRRIGSLGNRFGEMVEYMVLPNLIEKFKEHGFIFTKAYPHAIIKDSNLNFITEVDITLEDGDKTMIVEVKSKPCIDDIKEHIERMEKIRTYANSRNDKRKYLGAIAGMIFNDPEKQFAFKNGFYVVEPSGETFQIHVPKEPFSVKVW